MSKAKTNTTVSVNLTFPIFLVLTILKLANIIDWSWWIVTLPLWLPLAIAACLIALVFIFAGCTMGIDAIFDGFKKRNK
jgi:hypothetical protein